MLVIKRDGRRESVKFDKITARIEKLCYGLDSDYIDPIDVSKKVIDGLYDGVTTLECAKFIDWAIKQKINGLVHLFSKKTSKYNLLNLIKKTYRTKTQIIPDNKIKLDLSLNTQRSDLDYIVPDHKKMLDELKNISIIWIINVVLKVILSN